MKKKVFIIVGVVLGVIALFGGLLLYSNWQDKLIMDEKVSPYIKDYPTDILVIGEKMWFPEKLNVRYADKIIDEVLKTKEGCTEQFIILSNRTGSVEISQEELQLIAGKLNALECDFFCIGTALDAELVKAGIFSQMQAPDHSTGYVYHNYGQTWMGNGYRDQDFYFDDTPEGIFAHLESIWEIILDERYK